MKYGKMTNLGFYCENFINCHNNLPKYQPDDCKEQCTKCMDVVIDYHLKKEEARKILVSIPAPEINPDAIKKYAIFKMSANGQGGYDLVSMTDNFKPSENKVEAENLCSKMNEYKSDKWHYFTVFGVNDKNQPISPSGRVILR